MPGKRAADMLANFKSSLDPSSGHSGSSLLADIREGAERLANEVDEYLESTNHSSINRRKESNPLSDEGIADLQLVTARKLRELLPQSRDLLNKAQERNWIPLLLNWLNLHDRPAVQVESLLALTSIAELCAQQSYYQHTQAQSSAVAAAAQAAAAAVKGSSSSASSLYSLGNNSGQKNSTPATYPYPPLVAPTPGESVPFPPLSFSQTLSPEAIAAFDASLTSTIQNSRVFEKGKGNKSSFSLPSAALFESPDRLPASAWTPPTGGINFISLAPPPGRVHHAVPSNAFLPPPTPVPGPIGGSMTSFPQHLSPSAQHLLLRHADAIPTLISLVSSPNREVYEQALWILGSIAVGDSAGSNSSAGNTGASGLEGGRDKAVFARDVILAAGAMNQLIRCLEAHPENLSLHRIGSWTMSNLVEGLFQQPSQGKNGNKSSDYCSRDEIEIHSLLPLLRRLLHMADSEVLSYTCWTLSHLCDGPSSHIAEVVTSKDSNSPKGGLVPRLVELLLHPSWRVTKPALRTIGNIVCAECGDDNNSHSTTTDYTEVILECNAVPRLKDLVTHGNREIQKEACWTLSNIAAGTVDQINAVIQSGAIKPLVELVQGENTDQEVRSEACWVVLNATSCGSDAQIEILVDEGCVSVLGVLLSEASMVMMALEGLERVLQVEETREMMRTSAKSEELWAATEEKTENKKTSSKKKNRKKKEKQKLKKAKQDAVLPTGSKKDSEVSTEASLADETSKNQDEKEDGGREQETQAEENVEVASSSKPSGLTSKPSGDAEMLQGHQPAIDFVLYLQQTGSIIALAKLMDALDYGEHYAEMAQIIAIGEGWEHDTKDKVPPSCGNSTSSSIEALYQKGGSFSGCFFLVERKILERYYNYIYT
ncbi:unnamed protein product [Cylindrotheca closterium]|uniref:Importin subunit alpha n=1 Tax=Cylindrotheca closterium TaxID=2856 RepID=A0AAD2G3L2_9STRA|nr:unnamed protein product [Cylindrotheca closterium]